MLLNQGPPTVAKIQYWTYQGKWSRDVLKKKGDRSDFRKVRLLSAGKGVQDKLFSFPQTSIWPWAPTHLKMLDYYGSTTLDGLN